MTADATVALSEVLEQLPEDLQAGAPPEASLTEILAAAGRAPVPVGRFSRFWTLGTLQGKIAAAYTFWWLRTVWPDADERQRALNEPHLKAAVRVRGTMATTRMLTKTASLTADVTCTVDSEPCIQFGAPGLTLTLNGFAITGQADPATGCQGARVGNAAGTFNEEGIGAFDQADETILGPGLIQRFRGDGIMLFNSTRNLVTQVTAYTNCQSGILVSSSSDNHIESNVSVRNGASVFPCGGI